MLSGTITSADGAVANLPISYTVNGITSMTSTDAQGRYTIVAPRGAQVIITPQIGVGVTITPVSITETACQNRSDLNFVINPLV